ncbi:MAG: amidohydrolase family protein [Pseudomonadota bacterium]
MTDKGEFEGKPLLIRLITLPVAAVFCLLAASCTHSPVAHSPVAASQLADVLYVGPHVLTMDEAFAGADAVAVKDDSILWVRPQADWTGQATRTVELGERALLPGLIDAHGHFAFLASTVNMANVASPPVGTITNIAELQQHLRDYMAAQTPATAVATSTDAVRWVVGIGYDDSLLAERRHPNRDDLDAVSATVPIVLIHVSGHLAAANSPALALAGITAVTPDPPGGVIRRRSGSQEPDGVVEETAMANLRQYYIGNAELTQQEIDDALTTYASHGITTAQDGAASWGIYERLQRASLNIDLVVYPVGMADDFAIPDDVPVGEYQQRLKLGGIKLILDGSPQGKTAYLSAPYHVVPEGLDADYRGYPTVPQAQANAYVQRFVEAGVPMLVHCNGDAAAQMLIDALQQVDVPLGDHRTVMIHAQVLRETQLDTMQQLQVIPSFFSAHTFYWGDWHRDSVLGEQRAARISATRSALERDMPFTVHNDAPIVPPDMIRLLWATTNRQTRSGATLGEAQRISTYQALRAMTIDAAYQYFEEAEKGSITPGKQADLVILSANPLQMDASELLQLQVEETISRGVSIFQR